MSKILIIDDDVDITKVLSRQLQHAGFKVVVAYDGMQATEIAHKEGPDLIILDMMLPAGGGENKTLSRRCAALKIPLLLEGWQAQPDGVVLSRVVK